MCKAANFEMKDTSGKVWVPWETDEQSQPSLRSTRFQAHTIAMIGQVQLSEAVIWMARDVKC